MDKIEAYGILTEKLEEIASNYSVNLEEFGNKTFEYNVPGKSGRCYELGIKLGRGKNGVAELKGWIHDKSNYSFELLEETLAVPEIE